MKYTVIGSGVAGVSAAKQLNKLVDECDIRIISREKDPFYYRPRLIECLSGNVSVDDIVINDRDWFKEQDIQLNLGEEVQKVNTETQEVITDKNRYKYDKLLLAQGASNFVPPIPGIDLKGVYSLRNGQDAREIYEHIEKSEKAVVVGGGLLGLESAFNMIKAGLEVTVIEMADYLLQRQIDQEGAKILQKKLEKMGFSFRLNGKTSEVVGQDEVEGVKLADGELIPADLVLFSTGIRPNTDIISETPIETNKGIIVNEKMETSISNIYAAGDVAEYEGTIYGIWAPAMEEGKVAGQVMAGEDVSFDGFVPSYTLKVAGVNVVSAGQLEENVSSKLLNKSEENYCRAFLEEDKIVGAIIVGEYEDQDKLLKEIKKI
ncbi:MAG: NAD(P)/FAD-dependent oxidoreductase [Bacillota bacterium]